jgi:hypothetical protein
MPAQPSLLIGFVLLALSAAGLKSPSAVEPALAIRLDVPAPQDSAGGTIVADVNDDRKPDLLAKQRDVWNLRASLTWRGSLRHLDAVSRRISLTILRKWVSAAAVTLDVRTSIVRPSFYSIEAVVVFGDERNAWTLPPPPVIDNALAIRSRTDSGKSLIAPMSSDFS